MPAIAGATGAGPTPAVVASDPASAAAVAGELPAAAPVPALAPLADDPPVVEPPAPAPIAPIAPAAPVLPPGLSAGMTGPRDHERLASQSVLHVS